MDGILNLYQHLPYHISPTAFQIGSFQIHWYSLGYLAGFVAAYLLLRYRIARGENRTSRNPKSQIPNTKQISNHNFQNSKTILTKESLLDFMLYAIFGLLIGARLGYVLFYNLPYYLHHPLEILLPFKIDCFMLHASCFMYEGIYGMSFFGGVIGIILASLIFTKKYKISFWRLADFIIPAIPAGYFFGRIGNFLNGELFGRATQKFWGIYFPQDPLGLLRHPSQFYEAFFEGLVIFAILWSLRNFWTPGVQLDKQVRDTRCPNGSLFLLYLALYGFFRFIIEFFREPDPLPLGSFSVASPQVGLIFNFLTLGQIFALMLVVTSAIIYLVKIKKINHEKRN